MVHFYDKGRLAKEHSVNANANGNMDGRAREFGPTAR